MPSGVPPVVSAAVVPAPPASLSSPPQPAAITHSTPVASSAELAEYILDAAEVAVVPGEAFGAPGYLRLSYALGDDDLAEGVGRLQKLLGTGGVG